MSDLISRNALLAEYDRVHIGPPGGARKLMEDAPAVDAVEVVRCKDCKHAGNYNGYLTCPYYDDYSVDDNHFCAYGERKDHGET